MLRHTQNGVGSYSVLPRPLKSSSCYLKYFSVDLVQSFFPLSCSQLSLTSVDLALVQSLPFLSLSPFFFFFPLIFFLPSPFILHFPPTFPFFVFLYFPLLFSLPFSSLFFSPFSSFSFSFLSFSPFLLSFFYPPFSPYFFFPSFLPFSLFNLFFFPLSFLYISLLR